MNSHWRSRDLYKAWYMNAFALTDLQRIIAAKVSENLCQPVRVGRYVDITDSLHIYGSYFVEAAPQLKNMKDGDFTKRSWPTDHPAFTVMTQEAKEKLAQDPDWYANGRK